MGDRRCAGPHVGAFLSTTLLTGAAHFLPSPNAARNGYARRVLRVVIALLWIGITIYAIADWWRTPDERCPGRIPKALWLLLILLTIPSFSIGSIAWVILRAVARAEARQKGEPVEDASLFDSVRERVVPSPPPSSTPVAPDDDPEFLFRLERDLARKRAEERAAEEKAERERLAREREEERATAQADEEDTTSAQTDDAADEGDSWSDSSPDTRI